MSSLNKVVVDPDDQKNHLMASSEGNFFLEYNEISQLIPSLSDSSFDNESKYQNDNAQDKNTKSKNTIFKGSEKGESNSICIGDRALSRIRIVFDKYLECPTLLDSYLERITMALSKDASHIIHVMVQKWNDSDINNSNMSGGPVNIQDNQINDLVHHSGDRDEIKISKHGKQKLYQHEQLHHLKRLLSALYALCKVRGKKYVQRFLPCNSFDVEPMLHMLLFVDEMKNENDEIKKENDIEAHPWESIYSLLLWLGMLSLVPFDLTTIDSSIKCIANKEKGNKLEEKATLVSLILSTAKSHLSDPGPTRETAASCLASLLSRPDLEIVELEAFVMWANGVLKGYYIEIKGIGKQGLSSIFLVMGVVQTLSIIFKTGRREILIRRHLLCIELLWEHAIILAEMIAPKPGCGEGGAMMLRKLLVKLFARVGCAYLPPRVATWRYQRGRRSLLDNISIASIQSSKQGVTCMKYDDKSNPSDQKEATPIRSSYPNQKSKSTKISEEVLLHVPDQVEDSMAQLIQSLSDPSTIVRWSSAKGIGRLTERLPSVCADDVLDALLQLFGDTERDNSWHGACLSLAELSRRGLLLPSRLNEVVPLIVSALQYDVMRGQHSVGTHVRDAACYACWAFARSYDPLVLKLHLPILTKAIILTSLFDREINCRRGASACFQEYVGRQGSDNFKHGISILTTADYFSLSNRTDAFTSVAFQIAQFKEYRIDIIKHLYEVKLFHWDADIRMLTSKSLQGLTHFESSYFTNTVLPYLLTLCMNETLCVRHGAIIGVAEIILSLNEINCSGSTKVEISVELAKQVAEIVPNVEKARLYRGRGGEIMRSATCRLIQCLSISRISLTVKQQVRLLDSIDSNLKHPNEKVQEIAASAICSLMSSYFPVGSDGPSPRLQKRVVEKYINIVNCEDNPAATRGFALALGQLPSKLVAPSVAVLDTVLICLCDASHFEKRVGEDGDAATRRNAINALVLLSQTVGIGQDFYGEQETSTSCHVTLNKRQVLSIFECLLTSMNDYKTDRRGDVGSWCRIAAMNGLQSIVHLVIGINQGRKTTSSSESNLEHFHQACQSNFFDKDICEKVFCALLKQLGEKLDTVRSKAGLVIENILSTSNPMVPFVPDRHALLEALQIKEHNKPENRNTISINWSIPSVTFPLCVNVLKIDPYFESMISGMVISIGCLTESVSKNATKHFLDYMHNLKKNQSKVIRKVGNVLLKIFAENSKYARIILPLLSTLNKLFIHNLLDDLLNDKSCDFAQNLFLCLKTEATKCNDIKRLMAVVPVVLSLVHTQDTDLVYHKILPFLMELLTHRYPRIRVWTAEQFYIKLLEDDSFVPYPKNVSTTTNLLLEISWDQCLDPPGEVRQARNKIANLLGVSLSKKQLNGIAKRVKEKIVDEYESYASLVQESGR